MIDMYNALVEAAIEFRRASRKLLAEYKNLDYQERKSARSMDVAPGYSIIYCSAEDKYYCCNAGQTLE